ncbi:MAG: hypothetical protein ACRES9_02540 [Gammaproteobacteria bacterium]
MQATVNITDRSSLRQENVLLTRQQSVLEMVATGAPLDGVSILPPSAIVGAEAAAERPDGTLIPFLAHSVPLHDETGALAGAATRW